MNNVGRKEKVIKNVSSQMVASLIKSILGFILRKLFLDSLGQNLLGLNGLMTSIIGMLSLAELGVGEAINFSLYEPLAKNDTETITSIMKLYKKLYVMIGVIIGAVGLLLFPFITSFVDSSVPNDIIYVSLGLFLLDTFLSYCLSYYRNIVSADQKDYIIINIDISAQIILNIIQILILIYTKNYYLYIGTQVLVTFCRNFYISIYTKKHYPYLLNTVSKPLSKAYISKLSRNIKALFVSKISYFCVSGTDNILLSSFVSLSSVAIYNNYMTIINLLNQTFNMLIIKANSVIANFIVLNSEKDSYQLFKRIFFVNFVITSYVTLGIILFCNQVIGLWLGSNNTWSIYLVCLIAYNNYSRFILQTCEAFRGAAGLYSPKPYVKYISLMEGVVNLVFSLFFLTIIENGVLAVFLGTTISTIISTVFVPWIVYRFLFKKSLINFYVLYFKYLLATVVVFLISRIVLNVIVVSNPYLNILLGGIIYTLVLSVFYTFVFHRSDEFKYNISILKNMIKKGRE